MATGDEWENIITSLPHHSRILDRSCIVLGVNKRIPPHLDLVKLALYLISGRLKGMDARIVHTLHDEIIIETRDGIEDQVRVIVKASMEEVFGGIIPEVPFVAEIREADS
jgi:DNA polymerase I-like protein with 3'-5' exonuclease and polymerase domains